MLGGPASTLKKFIKSTQRVFAAIDVVMVGHNAELDALRSSVKSLAKRVQKLEVSHDRQADE
jgi:hypothetical protein